MGCPGFHLQLDYKVPQIFRTQDHGLFRFLQTALKGVNAEIKNTQTQLKDVEKLLKLDPGNTELLSQKQKLLADAVSETKQKLETLKTAAEQANQALANGNISQEQYDALQREIVETEEELKRLEALGI